MNVAALLLAIMVAGMMGFAIAGVIYGIYLLFKLVIQWIARTGHDAVHHD